MKPKKYKVMIDIYKGVLNNQLIEFTTQDHESNVLEFEILEDKVTPYNLDGCLVRMVINGQQQDCTIADATNGLVNITLHQSMFSEVGPVFAELQIYDAVNQTIRLTTPIFKYTVRKSLMDDNTVQADPNYSILQNMILEVSSADEVAKQAKKTAESAMTTANKAESKANQIMANGDYAKEQGDYAKTQGDRLQGMLTLDGAPQTKFDFIENKVVQDGLVGEIIEFNGDKKLKKVEFKKQIKSLHIICKMVIEQFYDQNASILLYPINGGDGVIQGVNPAGYFGYSPHNKMFYFPYLFNSRKSLSYDYKLGNEIEVELYIDFENGIGNTIRVNDKQVIWDEVPTYRYSSAFSLGSADVVIKGSAIAYDRKLPHNETQHNFSVLNNPPAIKVLHATDSTGKTSILKLGSDEDHVEMSSGRTLREEYMGVLKAMGKEVPSADGSPVKVPNGIEARVINAEIKGKTVKNEIMKSNFSDGKKGSWVSEAGYALNVVDDSSCVGGKCLEHVSGSATYKAIYTTIESIVSDDKYYYMVRARNSIAGARCMIFYGPTINSNEYDCTNWTKLSMCFSGNASVKQLKLASRAEGGNIYLDCALLVNLTSMFGKGKEPTKETCDSIFGYSEGLASTEAIISNNGQSYHIYEPTIQGKTRILDADTGLVPTDLLLPPLKDGDVLDLATKTITFANKSTQVLTDEQVKAYSKYKKVISLGGLGDTKDTLEILEDGSAIYTHAIPSLKPTSNDSTWVKKWTKDADKGTEFSRFYGRPFSNIPDVNKGICDKLELLDSLSWGSATKKGFAIQGNYCFCVPKSELGTDDVDGFKKWLDNLNCTILRTLGTTETPIVTHIPKELVPTVLTHKTNILEVGGAVKPSSFKVTVPVDRLAEIEARLQALESTTVDVVLNK